MNGSAAYLLPPDWDHEPAPLSELGTYGGVTAVRCEGCGHVSPSKEHLAQHRRRCWGVLRWAA